MAEVKKGWFFVSCNLLDMLVAVAVVVVVLIESSGGLICLHYGLAAVANEAR